LGHTTQDPFTSPKLIEQAVQVAFVPLMEDELEYEQFEHPLGQLIHCEVPPDENCPGKQAVQVPLLNE
jgi:hypothetical protein